MGKIFPYGPCLQAVPLVECVFCCFDRAWVLYSSNSQVAYWLSCYPLGTLFSRLMDSCKTNGLYPRRCHQIAHTVTPHSAYWDTSPVHRTRIKSCLFGIWNVRKFRGQPRFMNYDNVIRRGLFRGLAPSRKFNKNIGISRGLYICSRL